MDGAAGKRCGFAVQFKTRADPSNIGTAHVKDKASLTHRTLWIGFILFNVSVIVLQN